MGISKKREKKLVQEGQKECETEKQKLETVA